MIYLQWRSGYIPVASKQSLNLKPVREIVRIRGEDSVLIMIRLMCHMLGSPGKIVNVSVLGLIQKKMNKSVCNMKAICDRIIIIGG